MAEGSELEIVMLEPELPEPDGEVGVVAAVFGEEAPQPLSATMHTSEPTTRVERSLGFANARSAGRGNR